MNLNIRCVRLGGLVGEGFGAGVCDGAFECIDTWLRLGVAEFSGLGGVLAVAGEVTCVGVSTLHPLAAHNWLT